MAHRSYFKHLTPTRKRLKGRKDRRERLVKQEVRAECVERDGYCLVMTRVGILGQCSGPSTWAHLSGHRRSQTRGMAPEKRHDSRFTAMLCARHHRQEESGKYQVIYRTTDYANGPIGWEAREQKVA